jgi:hypothetical protein
MFLSKLQPTTSYLSVDLRKSLQGADMQPLNELVPIIQGAPSYGLPYKGIGDGA